MTRILRAENADGSVAQRTIPVASNDCPRWIPVTERLPEKSCDCWIMHFCKLSDGKKHREYAMWNTDRCPDSWDSLTGRHWPKLPPRGDPDMVSGTVVAWMPAPAPPEEEK